jgi:hypothetical protein
MKLSNMFKKKNDSAKKGFVINLDKKVLANIVGGDELITVLEDPAALPKITPKIAKESHG